MFLIASEKRKPRNQFVQLNLSNIKNSKSTNVIHFFLKSFLQKLPPLKSKLRLFLLTCNKMQAYFTQIKEFWTWRCCELQMEFDLLQTKSLPSTNNLNPSKGSRQKKGIFYGQADRKRWPSPTRLTVSFFCDFFCVHLT